MSVIRVHKTKNFTVMSNYHFKEKDMSLKAKGLLSLMLSLPDDWNYSISGLVKLSKDGKDGVMSALSELEAFGYLRRTRVINEKGQFSGVDYDIFEEPEEKEAIAGNPISAIPISVKPISENPTQLNTNQLSTNIINDLDNKNTKETEEIEAVLIDVKNIELQKLYRDYLDMRKQINSPLTNIGLGILIERCERLSQYDTQQQKTLLEAAIINNWKNVYIGGVEVRDSEEIEEKRKMYLKQ